MFDDVHPQETADAETDAGAGKLPVDQSRFQKRHVPSEWGHSLQAELQHHLSQRQECALDECQRYEGQIFHIVISMDLDTNSEETSIPQAL